MKIVYEFVAESKRGGYRYCREQKISTKFLNSPLFFFTRHVIASPAGGGIEMKSEYCNGASISFIKIQMNSNETKPASLKQNFSNEENYFPNFFMGTTLHVKSTS